MPPPSDITLTAAEGRPMRGALALPAGGGRRPGVIVIHEIFGLNDDIRRITGRVADLGYVALAPDLYDAGAARPLCVLRTLLAMRTGQGGTFADLDAAQGWLAARPEVDGARIGVVGFCMGGGFALLHAIRSDVRVAGVFYGDVPSTAAELRGVCPVLASYGARDRPFAGQGRRLERLLGEIDVPHDVRVYPDAGHSFMSHHEGPLAAVMGWGPMAVGFEAGAEADSWARLERFFREHLGSPGGPPGGSSGG